MRTITYTEDRVVFGDHKVIFDPIPHKYYLDDGSKTKLTSVTTVIGKYEIPFQKEYWAKRKAQERGISVEAVLEEWDHINKTSLVRGNRIHDFLESNVRKEISSTQANIINAFSLDLASGISKTSQLESSIYFQSIEWEYPIIAKYLRKLIENGYILFAENRIVVPRYKIAGTIDLLAVKNDFNNFIIVDWKTNKKPLHFKAGYVNKKTGDWVDKQEFFKAPLNFIPFCKGNIYTLQLSTYAYMVEQYGLFCEGLALFHIKQNEVTKQEEVFPYRLSYMRNSVKDMLEHHLEYYASI